jgi:hypothetical protein
MDLLKKLLTLEAELEKAQTELARARLILQGAICKRCGGLSWEVPLVDYCKCQPEKPKEPPF